MFCPRRRPAADFGFIAAVLLAAWPSLGHAPLENGHVTWKVLGPDPDKAYDGQNGIGVFEAIVPGRELFCPIIGDAPGHEPP